MKVIRSAPPPDHLVLEVLPLVVAVATVQVDGCSAYMIVQKPSLALCVNYFQTKYCKAISSCPGSWLPKYCVNYFQSKYCKVITIQLSRVHGCRNRGTQVNSNKAPRVRRLRHLQVVCLLLPIDSTNFFYIYKS